MSHYLGDTEEHRKVSCLERIYPFSLRVPRLASRHSKGVEYWGSGLEAVDPMAITKRGDKPPLPERLRVPREAGGPYSRSGRLPPELGTEEGRSRRPKPEVYTAVRDVSLTSW